MLGIRMDNNGTVVVFFQLATDIVSFSLNISKDLF